MNQHTMADDLATSVDGLIAALEILFDDLGKEREALKRRCGADELEYIALRKSMAVEHVANLYSGLREVLAAAHGTDDVSDALANLRSHVPSLGERANRLVDLTRACQLANQENGALIGAGLQNTERALNTLHQLHEKPAASTYSASGHTRSQESSNYGLTVRA